MYVKSFVKSIFHLCAPIYFFLTVSMFIYLFIGCQEVKNIQQQPALSISSA